MIFHGLIQTTLGIYRDDAAYLLAMVALTVGVPVAARRLFRRR